MNAQTKTNKPASAVSKAQQTKLDNLPTKSAKIRYLAAEGLTRSQIATTLQIKYQHVRNVLITPVKTQRS